MRAFFLILTFFALFFQGCEKKDLVFEGNKDKKPIEFPLHKVQCPKCHMEVDSLSHSVQVITNDGKTYIFDDPGCMVLWLEDNKIDPKSVTIWAYTGDTHRWIDAKKAWYSLTDQTPMNYGFGAYENRKEGYVDFETMRIKMLRGENLANPKIRKKLLNR
ncbi:MAG: hypothetical protein GXO31_02555 [Epsilonproteobacteria bacterium]|nr:hypothetical protein [Campylobacterota bacterium]